MRSIFIILPLLTSSFLMAQDATQTVSPETKKEDNPTRTLRVMIVGSRALPAFETRGAKIVEVDPPLSAMPPTSFAFANPSHAPKIKGKKRGEKRIRKTSYSAWANELVRLKNYKGPEFLPLHLKRGLISPTDYQRVECQLGKSINPFIVISPSKGSQGWKEPKAKVIDWDPIKHPARSALVINESPFSIKIFFSKEGVIIGPGKHKHFKLKLNDKKTFRYKVLASDGKSKEIMANSQYRLNKNSRLIVVALPGVKTKATKFARPTLRIVSDTL